MMGILGLVIDVNTGGKFQGVDTGNQGSGLRIAISHPTRSIITAKHSVEKLWERVDRIEEVLFLLGQDNYYSD